MCCTIYTGCWLFIVHLQDTSQPIKQPDTSPGIRNEILSLPNIYNLSSAPGPWDNLDTAAQKSHTYLVAAISDGRRQCSVPDSPEQRSFPLPGHQ